MHKEGFFPVDERVALIKQATNHLANVKVAAFSGLLTDFMQKNKAQIIVRGIRSVKDLEYEENEAYMIRHLAPAVDTVFLLTRPEYSFVSSSGIRELYHFNGTVHGLVPKCVEQAMLAKARERK